MHWIIPSTSPAPYRTWRSAARCVLSEGPCGDADFGSGRGPSRGGDGGAEADAGGFPAGNPKI